jgi:hypothetical protein
MLNVTVPYPHAGCIAYMDDVDPDGNDVVEKVRIIAHKPEDRVLIAIHSHRYPGQVASGNRTVSLSQLREHERAAPIDTPLLGHTDLCPHINTKFPWKCDCQKKAAAKRTRLEKIAQPSGRTKGRRR